MGGPQSLRPEDTYREVVLIHDERARKAHQELFSFDESRYVLSTGSMVASFQALADQGISRIHIAADWEHILMIAFWTDAKPGIFDVLSLLRKSGARETELHPFKSSDINDLFPWLYYGKKFDILRRVCSAAKQRAEAGSRGGQVHVICHLVADDTCRIAASSL